MEDEKKNEKPPEVDAGAVRTRMCCGRVTIHILRVSAPIAGLADDKGVEMNLAFGSSVENARKADTVALLDANDRVIATAPLDRVPDIRDALSKLAQAMVNMHARPDFRTALTLATHPSDGVKH